MKVMKVKRVEEKLEEYNTRETVYDKLNDSVSIKYKNVDFSFTANRKNQNKCLCWTGKKYPPFIEVMSWTDKEMDTQNKRYRLSLDIAERFMHFQSLLS